MLTSWRLLLVWYITAIVSLVFATVFLSYLSFTQKIVYPPSTNYQNFRALPDYSRTTIEQTVEITKGDGRVAQLINFFKNNKSTLNLQAETFVEVADQYSLDYRLLPAIAMQESKGGKYMPKGSNNPFGYGISGGKITKFASLEEAIEAVTKSIKDNYYDQGLKTPEEMMTKYAPASINSQPTWAEAISAYINQIR